MTQAEFSFEPTKPMGKLEQAFWHFHRENPHVFVELRDMAMELRSRGVQRWGIAGLFETLRYNHAIKTDGDEFKLNNNFRAFFARLLMAEVDDLHKFFETREQRIPSTLEAT